MRIWLIMLIQPFKNDFLSKQKSRRPEGFMIKLDAQYRSKGMWGKRVVVIVSILESNLLLIPFYISKRSRMKS